MLRAIFLFPVLLPALCAQTAPIFVASAGYSFPDLTQVARGLVITLFVHGLQVPNAVAEGAPWPTMLSGLTVAVQNPPTPNYPSALPIYSVFSSPTQCSGGNLNYCDTTAVTVQIPFEPLCVLTGNPDSCNTFSTPLSLVVNAGGTSQVFTFAVASQASHVLNTCDTIFGTGGICSPVITHASGTPVSTSAPARPGEEILLYAVGLGPTQNGTQTGQAASAPDPVVAIPYLSFGFWMDTPGAAGPAPTTLAESGQVQPVSYAGLVSGYVGLYQMNVMVPSDLPSGLHVCQGFADTNVRIFLGSGPGPSQASESPFVDLCVKP